MEQLKEQLANLEKVIQLLVGSIEGLSIRITRVEERLDRIEARLDRIEARLDRVEERLDRIEARLDVVEARLHEADGKFDLIQFNFENVHKKLDFVIDEIVKIDGVTRYVDIDKNLKTIKSR